MDDYKISSLSSRHYTHVIDLIDEWWGGRAVTAMLPRLFFTHFSDTSFAVEANNRCVAFLSGFISQTKPSEAYIHFVGIDPEHRRKSLARTLYHRFATVVGQRGVSTVRAVTSPNNKGSIEFHTRVGFEMCSNASGHSSASDDFVHENYDGQGEDRVLFRISVPRLTENTRA